MTKSIKLNSHPAQHSTLNPKLSLYILALNAAQLLWWYIACFEMVRCRACPLHHGILPSKINMLG